jgi:peptidyl-Asp metalloendopeptidase
MACRARVSFGIFLASLIGGFPLLAGAQGQSAAAIFESAPGAALTAEHAVTRARGVSPAFGVLQRAVASLNANPRSPVSAQADFFLDAPVTLRFERTEMLPDGTEALIGGVEGDPYGSVVIVFKNGIISGNVIANRRAFQIRSRGHAVHEVREMDQSLFKEAKADTLAPPVTKAYGTPIYAGMMTDDGSTIDVMVLYTAAARAAAGGAGPIQNQANLGITETNTAYANTGVSQRLRLVYAGEIQYEESGDILTDLQPFASRL